MIIKIIHLWLSSYLEVSCQALWNLIIHLNQLIYLQTFVIMHVINGIHNIIIHNIIIRDAKIMIIKIIHLWLSSYLEVSCQALWNLIIYLNQLIYLQTFVIMHVINGIQTRDSYFARLKTLRILPPLISLTSLYSNECYGSTYWYVLTTVKDDWTIGRSS